MTGQVVESKMNSFLKHEIYYKMVFYIISFLYIFLVSRYDTGVIYADAWRYYHKFFIQELGFFGGLKTERHFEPLLAALFYFDYYLFDLNFTFQRLILMLGIILCCCLISRVAEVNNPIVPILILSMSMPTLYPTIFSWHLVTAGVFKNLLTILCFVFVLKRKDFLVSFFLLSLILFLYSSKSTIFVSSFIIALIIGALFRVYSCGKLLLASVFSLLFHFVFKSLFSVNSHVPMPLLIIDVPALFSLFEYWAFGTLSPFLHLEVLNSLPPIFVYLSFLSTLLVMLFFLTSDGDDRMKVIGLTLLVSYFAFSLASALFRIGFENLKVEHTTVPRYSSHFGFYYLSFIFFTISSKVNSRMASVSRSILLIVLLLQTYNLHTLYGEYKYVNTYYKNVENAILNNSNSIPGISSYMNDKRRNDVIKSLKENNKNVFSNGVINE